MFGLFGNAAPRAQDIEAILKAAGLDVETLRVDKGDVTALLVVAPDADRAAVTQAIKDAEAKIHALRGVKKLRLIPTITRSAEAADNDAPPLETKKALPPKIDTGVPIVIAVSSGKGGVGKSTVAVNLACALAAMGKRVGLLDADIYGPSLPRLMGIADAKTHQVDGKIGTVAAHGVSVMSIGFMVAEDAPLVWRGPMATGALKQLLTDTNWNGCEVLVLDLPPGTGDIQLTLAQGLKLTGAIIVSTPQDIAWLDARKGIEMFRKTGVPVLGVVENMSYYCCPNCNARDDIFGHGGAANAAREIGVDLLAEVPLESAVRFSGDAGKPIVLAQPDTAPAAAYRALAQRILSDMAQIA